MDTILDVFQDGISIDPSAGLSYEGSLSYDTICESVQNASDFFSISDPLLTIDGYTTGVYNNIPFTEADDVLIFNRQQLLDMGICERDGLDLVMTHECAHRALQGMDLGFDAHQEELCCDYMAGVRAGLNDIDISHMLNSLRDTMECESHPAGLERVDAIEAGVQFAQDFTDMYGRPPSFSECLDNFTGEAELEHIVHDGHITLWPEPSLDGYSPNCDSGECASGVGFVDSEVDAVNPSFKGYTQDEINRKMAKAEKEQRYHESQARHHASMARHGLSDANTEYHQRESEIHQRESKEWKSEYQKWKCTKPDTK